MKGKENGHKKEKYINGCRNYIMVVVKNTFLKKPFSILLYYFAYIRFSIDSSDSLRIYTKFKNIVDITDASLQTGNQYNNKNS